MKKSMLLVLAAGGLVPLAAAQTEIPVAAVEEMREVYPVGAVPPTTNPYESRFIDTVYNNGGEAGTSTNGLVLGTTHWADDVSFAPGPWASTATRLATEVIVWTQQSGASCIPNDPFDLVLDFYDSASFDYTQNPMNTAPAFQRVRVAITGYNCGVQTGWIVNLAGLPGGGLTLPANDPIYIEYRITTPGTDDLRIASGGVNPVFTIGSTLVGSSVPGYGRDVNSNNILEGGSPIIIGAGAGAHEHRTTAASPIDRNQRGRIRGDIPPPPPPPATDLGPLADTGAGANGSLSAGQVQWYQFTLNGDATDNALQFLDIDTEGSAADVAIGLYNADGGILFADQDDGSGTNAQLTAGVGRRAAAGDGEQYDGRDGEALAGTYYLAVAPGGSTFGAAFTVTADQNNTGDFAVNLRTNTNGSPLAAAVAPAVPLDRDLGQILSPGIGGADVTIPRQGVAWWKFEVCGPISNPANFFDIDFSLSNVAADTEVFIFDSNGALVVQNDDADRDGAAPFYTRSQLSFGNTGPRTSFDPLAQDFAGQDGDLPAGTYYMAVGLFNTEPLPTQDRWHLRSASGSSLPVVVDFYTDLAQCGGGCPVCAADYDQSGGVDGDDIGAFFADWQIGAPCGDVDGSGGIDGDDIGFFFERWQAGGCN